MFLRYVSGKIPCVFEINVEDDCSSNKRPDQRYVVTASPIVRSDAVNLFNGWNGCTNGVTASEKLDGTCVMIKLWNDIPWLWARHDRKLTKAANKRYKAHTKESNDPFQFDIDIDFKDVPNGWTPATLSDRVENGHIMGWVPINPTDKNHCWHASVIDPATSICVVLKQAEAFHELHIAFTRMNTLLNSTLELIGTNVNGNPYRIGSKREPIHYLVPHGSIRFITPTPKPNYDSCVRWFNGTIDDVFGGINGAVEGIVWHNAANGAMYKLHRHHLKLQWPLIDQPLRMLAKPVRINIATNSIVFRSELMRQLYSINGKIFDSLDKVTFVK